MPLWQLPFLLESKSNIEKCGYCAKYHPKHLQTTLCSPHMLYYVQICRLVFNLLPNRISWVKHFALGFLTTAATGGSGAVIVCCNTVDHSSILYVLHIFFDLIATFHRYLLNDYICIEFYYGKYTHTKSHRKWYNSRWLPFLSLCPSAIHTHTHTNRHTLKKNKPNKRYDTMW